MLVSFQDLWNDEKQEGSITKITATNHSIEAEGPLLKKKKKIEGSRYNLFEFPIFCCSVYPCGWLPQKIL